ncbi:HEAT repeat domain-containing protein [Cryptosporangium japonicum]|uniref:HEAT repeat protein n=1 Tax=Cryptosporangium japonicum TaxID=80872 RepID=A0ABN0UB52_9ACTN
MDLTTLAGDPTSEPDDLAGAVDAAAGEVAAFGPVLGLVDHDAPAVRTAVARALPHLAAMEINAPFAPLAVDALISLTSDPHGDVRNWACFGLGTQMDEVDGTTVREALAARLTDRHGEARREALIGLARRRDPRALPAVRAALCRSDVWLLEVEAAGALGESSLHPLVIRHLDGWDGGAARTVAAVARLTDPDGLGADLIDGLAAWYRSGGPLAADADPGWWRIALDLLELAPYRATELASAVAGRLGSDQHALDVLDDSTLGAIARTHGWVGVLRA